MIAWLVILYFGLAACFVVLFFHTLALKEIIRFQKAQLRINAAHGQILSILGGIKKSA